MSCTQGEVHTEHRICGQKTLYLNFLERTFLITFLLTVTGQSRFGVIEAEKGLYESDFLDFGWNCHCNNFDDLAMGEHWDNCCLAWGIWSFLSLHDSGERQ